MAACPFCAEEIAVDLSKCPHCGSRLIGKGSESHLKRVPSGVVKRILSEVGRTVILLVLGVGGFLFCLFCIIAIISKFNEPARESGLSQGSTEPSSEKRTLTFRKMHDAAWADWQKGASAKAAGRQFKGISVEMEVTVGDRLAGICTLCFSLSFPRELALPVNPRDRQDPSNSLDRGKPLNPLTFIAMPDPDLDAIRFGILLEKSKGTLVHIKGTVGGGIQSWSNSFSPLLVLVTSVERLATENR